MDSLNTLRAVLVASAALAALILLTQQRWLPAVVLLVGITAHSAMFAYQHRLKKQREAELDQGLRELLEQAAAED